MIINLVPTQSGKVTLGLASHWPCITDNVVYPPMGSMSKDREMSSHAYVLWGVAVFTLSLSTYKLQSSFLLCIVTVQGIAYIPFKYLYTSMVAPLSPIYKRWQVHNFPAFIIWHVVQATSYFNGTSLNKL